MFDFAMNNRRVLNTQCKDIHKASARTKKKWETDDNQVKSSLKVLRIAVLASHLLK